MIYWRPKEWAIPRGADEDNMYYRDAFEAGANAMLEVIRKTFKAEIGMKDNGDIYCNLSIEALLGSNDV